LNLHEYQAKEILARYGVPVPPGRVAYTPEEAKRIAEEFGKRVVIKAQVHVGGRGKAGGVKLADTPAEAYEKAQAILGMNIKGLTVKKVLVAEAVDIAKEYYAGLILDRSKKRVVLMLSKEGGVDIEEVAAQRPEAIHKFWIDPHKGLRAFEAREMVRRAGLEGNLNKLAQVLVALYRAYEGVDASIAEINPLVVTTDGAIVAADAKIVLDDNALFRHPELAELREVEAEHPLEVEASNYGFAYVKLDGNIGVIGNGAGLVMYTLDLVNRVGAGPPTSWTSGAGPRRTWSTTPSSWSSRTPTSRASSSTSSAASPGRTRWPRGSSGLSRRAYSPSRWSCGWRAPPRRRPRSFWKGSPSTCTPRP
jgi:succinyl-CoA synthetase beta subunit